MQFALIHILSSLTDCKDNGGCKLMQDFSPLYLWRYTDYSQNNRVKNLSSFGRS